jgi:glycosyltransferase involved in cell wall biosynthesis
VPSLSRTRQAVGEFATLSQPLTFLVQPEHSATVSILQRCEITVVIPAYNRARLVGRALQSVLDQTVQPAQIIVVDDGSTDNTSEVCQAYGRSVQYVWQKNSGASVARNAGIRLASQPWIAFLDSDDYFTPSHLERMITAIRETAGKALFYFSDLKLPETEGGGTLWEATGFSPSAPFHLTNDASPWVFFKRQPTMLQSSVIGKRALEIVGGLDESRTVGEDSYLFCQLGIGGIACAVSGIGCVQTADDLSNVRLTVENPLGSEKYLSEHCSRWRDVLRWKERLPPEYSRLIAYNLAGAHFGLVKLMWRSGRRVEAMSHFLLGSQADPQLAAWLIRNRSSKAYEETVRPR